MMSDRHFRILCSLALVALTASATLAVDGMLRPRNVGNVVVATVDGRAIHETDVLDTAGCELTLVLSRADTLRYEAREYLIAAALIEAESRRAQRTPHEIFLTEIGARLPTIPDTEVQQRARLYSPDVPPTPLLLDRVRTDLERDAVRRRLDQYLSNLSVKYSVMREQESTESDAAASSRLADALGCRDRVTARSDASSVLPGPPT